MPPETASRLQDGIYFASGTTPLSAYRLVLLNVRDAASSAQVGAALATMWGRLQLLRQGVVDEAAGSGGDPAELTCLLGFGAPLFARFAGMARPSGVEPLGDLPFKSIRWVAADRRTGEADLAVQLIAKSEFAVERAVVDLWTWTSSAQIPLQVHTVYNGFKREDGRSWLGFHDGVNNIESSQRRGVIEAAGGNPAWMDGGTYMAFLRLALDLVAWRQLPLAHQEIIVGRDKQTGCPLVRVDPGLEPVAIAGCPAGPNHPESASYRNPALPGVDQGLLRQSHMHRVNLNRQSPPGDEQNNRIFRQGYEFVESLGGGGLRVGLNFVSFQRSLGNLTRILHLPGWLGDANFGGVADASAPAPGGLAPLKLVSVIAGGYYAVPPSAEPFPGADIF
jgi:deferrochelatase/peroxidase EfeB